MRALVSCVLVSVLLGCSPTPQTVSPPSSPNAVAPPAGASGNPYAARPGEQMAPVKAAWCAVSAGFVQMFVARDYHIFSRYGLDVETSQFTDSNAALAALQKGEIDFLYCAAAATIPGLATGIDATIVGAPLVGLPYVMVARSDIQSVQDLKGRKVGINRPGDLDDRLSRAVIKQANVPLDQVQFIPAGGQTDRYKAVLAGLVDAVNVTPPLEVQAKLDGLNIIYSLKSLPIPFIYSAIHTNSKTLKERPQVVQKFVAAMADSVYYIDQHKEDTEQSIAKQLNITDPAALESAYRAYAEDYVNRSVDIPMAAVQDSIDFAREQGTNIVRGTADQIVDQRYAADLQRSGFLQNLWGRPVPSS